LRRLNDFLTGGDQQEKSKREQLFLSIVDMPADERKSKEPTSGNGDGPTTLTRNSCDDAATLVLVATFELARYWQRILTLAGFIILAATLRIAREVPSAQFCSGVVEKWRAREDETGHCYVIVIPIDL
jgi:hypothetical protein